MSKIRVLFSDLTYIIHRPEMKKMVVRLVNAKD